MSKNKIFMRRNFLKLEETTARQRRRQGADGTRQRTEGERQRKRERVVRVKTRSEALFTALVIPSVLRYFF